MRYVTPPRWAEMLLERLLEERDRESVVGDLREEYAESVAPRVGRARASVWYARQVASFLPRLFPLAGPMKKILLPVSFFTLACACWLAVMEMVLRHPGYVLRIGTAALIAAISLGTIAVRRAKPGVCDERWLWLGAAGLLWIGGEAFYRNARAEHFEGFVLVIAVALIVQGVLMVVTVGGRRKLV